MLFKIISWVVLMQKYAMEDKTIYPLFPPSIMNRTMFLVVFLYAKYIILSIVTVKEEGQQGSPFDLLLQAITE